MNPGFDTYIRKLKHYKELYLIDEESYGDLSKKSLDEMKVILNDFIKYVELTSNMSKSSKPSSQGNWCDPNVESDSSKNNEFDFRRYGIEK